MAAKPKVKYVEPDFSKVRPHNGEGRPDLWFKDPVDGDWIGGQVAAVRMAMRYPHVVCPWARRQGKTKFRQFLIVNEAQITPMDYYAGICYPDHTTAYKIADDFIRSWAGMVRDYKNPPDHQDRWIELNRPVPPRGMPPPPWFLPDMKKRWKYVQETRSIQETVCKVYMWSTTLYEKIQGFPHHFNRVDWDEAQQIHPAAYGIVRPMLDDVGGFECWSGTPWSTGIGNVQFEKFWDIAGDPTANGWFRMRVPHGTNPHVKKKTDAQMRGVTEQEKAQVLYARFLTGEGAVFSNIDNVLTLKPMNPEDPTLSWVKALRTKHKMPSMQWWVHKADPDPSHIYGASVDWARSPHGDYSVLMVFDLTTGEQVALFRWRGEHFSDQMEMVLAIRDHYNAEQLHADANGMGIPMADFMRRRHSMGFVGHQFRGGNKEHYVRTAQILFVDADIQMIDCPEQRHEFKSFSAFEGQGLGSAKRVTYSAPSGENDDFVDTFMQIGQTLSICGRQHVPKEEPPVPPMVNEQGQTTLELWAEGEDTPFSYDPAPEDGSFTWDDVVVIPRD